MLTRLLGRMNPRSGYGAAPQNAGRVSIVIPLHNHAGYIADAVASAVAQGEVVGEIVVVDDGSTDASFGTVREIARVEPKIVCWSHPNRGAAATLVAAIARTSGAFVAILNSDDLFRPGRLVALAAALDADPALAMATSAIEFIDADGAPVRNEWHERALAFAASCDDAGTALLNANHLVTTSNFVIRRSVLDTAGGFAPLRYAHDLDFALRVLASGLRIDNVEAPAVAYRTHASNTIAEDHGRVRVEWALCAGAYLARRTRGWIAAPDGTDRLLALYQVLDDHRILRGALLAASRLATEPTLSLERAALLRDDAFLDTLRRAVQV